MSSATSIRLHLGCGERYLDGYVNVDFPPESQSVLDTSKADVFADLTRLAYEPTSIAEIRLHHVFEHFDRSTALRLLLDWYDWLLDDGVLVIETPDFERCARGFFTPWQRRRRGVLLRHIFGSHEASWAVHQDGWYKAKFRRHLTALGYTDLAFKRQSWRGTHNITVTARVGDPRLSRDTREAAAESLLRESLVDARASSEMKLLAVWLRELRRDVTQDRAGGQ
jgi:predicted SAM-dependent methyltransferase